LVAFLCYEEYGVLQVLEVGTNSVSVVDQTNTNCIDTRNKYNSNYKDHAKWQDQMTQYYKTRLEIVFEGDGVGREVVQYWDGGVG
jgi:hypothetical protein